MSEESLHTCRECGCVAIATEEGWKDYHEQLHAKFLKRNFKV